MNSSCRRKTTFHTETASIFPKGLYSAWLVRLLNPKERLPLKDARLQYRRSSIRITLPITTLLKNTTSCTNKILLGLQPLEMNTSASRFPGHESCHSLFLAHQSIKRPSTYVFPIDFINWTSILWCETNKPLAL